METITTTANASMLPGDDARRRWYAAYTCPRHEKCVARQLTEKRIDHFLPLYQECHRWKDRRKLVQLALFPGYVFVHIPLEQRLQVLQVASVVQLVSFAGRPAPLADAEIEALRRGLLANVRVEPHPFLKAGRRARIIHGPLMGSEGVLVRRKQGLRVVLSIDMIMRSVAVEVDEKDIVPAT
jgi:transcription antitermination factor NusG